MDLETKNFPATQFLQLLNAPPLLGLVLPIGHSPQYARDPELLPELPYLPASQVALQDVAPSGIPVTLPFGHPTQSLNAPPLLGLYLAEGHLPQYARDPTLPPGLPYVPAPQVALHDAAPS